MIWRRGHKSNIRGHPLEIITRDGCHLCEKAMSTVRLAAVLSGRSLLVTDLEDRPDLIEYTHRVPVVRVGSRVIAEEAVPLLPTWWAALFPPPEGEVSSLRDGGGGLR